MTAYLVDHPPRLRQFKARTARPTGLTVLHTAESILDSIGPDTGAEAVARFMTTRTTYGSYHDLVDSDSALQLVPYDCQAYQDGTGSNPHAMSIGFALRTSDWSRLSREKRAAFLRSGAEAFVRQQAWLRAHGLPTTPLRRITRSQSESGAAGFITHAERDPARRSDPGPDFPWGEWFAACADATAPPTPPEEDDMYTPDDRSIAAGRHTQLANELGLQRSRLVGLHARMGALEAAIASQGSQGAARVAEAKEGAAQALAEWDAAHPEDV